MRFHLPPGRAAGGAPDRAAHSAAGDGPGAAGASGAPIWHVSDDELAQLAGGDSDDAAAWSGEAHLLACPSCRERLAAVSAGQPAAARSVAAVRTRLLADLPAQVPVARGDGRRRLTALSLGGSAARVPFLLAVVAVLAAAVVLDRVGHGVLGGDLDGAAAGTGWLRLLAPLLPLGGVALAYGPTADPAHEVVATTPAGGLRLLLVRTAVVLAVTLPGAVVLGLVTGGWAGLAWLLPAVAFTAGTLATGTVVPLELAAAGWALAWVLLAGAPLLRPAATGSAGQVLSPGASAGWAVAVLVVACAVLALRREHLRLPQRVDR